MSKLTNKLLEKLLPAEVRKSGLRDFENTYSRISEKKGKFAACFWFWLQIFQMLPSYMKDKIIWSLTMFKNYVKIALRNIRKNKGYTLISISGLSIGLACCLLVLLFMQHEFNYDNFHKNADRIYRIGNYVKYQDREYDGEQYVAALGPALKDEFMEVEYSARFSFQAKANFEINNKKYIEAGVRFADNDVFDIFSFELLYGNPDAALTIPFTVVLSRSLSEKYFGTENPVGQTIRFDNNYSLSVTGVFEDIPENSHIDFNALVSFSSQEKIPGNYLDWNGGNRFITYIKIKQNTSPEELQQKFPAFLEKHTGEFTQPGTIRRIYLQKLKDIHLIYNKNIGKIYLLGAIGLITVILACINSIIMTTANSVRRAKEVGLKKVVGADRKMLIKQFLGESVLYCFVSFILSLVIARLFLPVFNGILLTELHLSSIFTIELIAASILLIIITGLFSGSYPAFYLASFEPGRVLKSNAVSGKDRIKVRNALVIVQFTVSIALITCTLIVYNQLSFFKNRDLNFDKDDIIVTELSGEELGTKKNIFLEKFSSVPGVLTVSSSDDIPGRGYTSNGYKPEGCDEWMIFNALAVDYNYLDMMGIEFKQGRNFSRDFTTDKNACIINQALADKLGWAEPLGKKIYRGINRNVIGVVKNYNFASLHRKINPLIITLQNEKSYNWDRLFISMKIRPENIQETISQLSKKWKEIHPSAQFRYFFLDESIRNAYSNEQRFGRIFMWLTILSIFIACLGLFGLSSYDSQQRTKEIGIRKVLGASAKNVIVVISKKYIMLVFMSNILAVPTAYFAMNKWLENYAYRTDVGISVFIISASAAILIAFSAVLYYALKAAYQNPVESLKHE